MPKQLNIDLRFNADTAKARQEIQQLQQQLNSLMNSSISQTSLKGFSTEIANAQQSVIKLQSALNNSLNTDTGRLDLSKFNQQLLDSDLTINKLASDLSALGPEGNKAFVQVANSIVTAQKPIAETNKLLNETWTAIKNTARWQISSSILHGFIGALQGALGYAQDLNKSLNSIRIVSGQTTEQMADFAEHANRAAQSLSTSTLAYTDAALIFYQQGLRGEEVTERVDTVLKLSNITGQSAESVSSYMTAIWNNFDDGSASLESYADKITALGAATASSSEEIAKGMQQFAAVAETVGLSYDYAATALATVVAQTRQSESTVGNSFRTIFSRLQGLKLGDTLEDGTDLNKYSAALETVGVNIKDQNGELKDMDTILDEIGAKWKTLAKDQQIALAQTVGGVRQYTNLVALFENWDQFQENLTVTQNAEGKLQEQADLYAESWEAAKKRVKAAWQSIYQDLLDDKLFIGFNNGLASVLKTIDGLIDSMGGLKGLIFGLIAAWTTWKPQSAVNALDGIVDRMKHIALLGPKDAETGQRQSWAEVEAAEVQRKTIEELNARKDSLIGMDSNSSIIESLIKEATWYDEIRKKKKEGISFSEKEIELIDSQIAHIKKLAEAHKNRTDELNQSAVNYAKAKRDATRNLSEEGNNAFNDIFGENANSKYQTELDNLSKINSSTEAYTNKVNELTDAIHKELEEYGIEKEVLEKVIDAHGRKAQAQEAEKNSNQTLRKEYSRVDEELDRKDKNTSIKTISTEIEMRDSYAKKIAEVNELKQKNEELRESNEKLKESFSDTTGIAKDNINDLVSTWREYSELSNKETISDDEFQKILEKTSELKEFAKEAKIPYEDLIEELKKLSPELQNNADAINHNDKAMNEAGKEAGVLKDKLESLGNINTNTNQPFWLREDFSKNVVNTTRALSSFAMGINSLKSGFNTLANEDLSWWERISGFITSLSMSLGMLANSFKAFSNGKLFSSILDTVEVVKNTKATNLNTLAKKQNEQATVAAELKQAALDLAMYKGTIAAAAHGEAVDADTLAHAHFMVTQKEAEIAQHKANLALLASEIQSYKTAAGVSTLSAVVTILTKKLKALVLAHPLITALAVAVTALGAAWAWFSHQQKKREEAIKAEEEAIKSNREAVQELTNAYQELQSTLKSIDDKRKAVETMTKGTQEWRAAVSELNAEMLKLIDEYNLIGSGKDPDYVINEGRYELTEAGQQKINEAAIEKEKQARILDISTERQNANVYAARNNSAIEKNTGRLYFATGKNEDEYNEVINQILNLDQELMDKLKHLVETDADKDKLEEFLKNDVGMNEEYATIMSELISSNSDLASALTEDKEAVDRNTAKIHEMQKAEMYNIFGSDISDKTADFLAEEAEKLYQQEYDAITTVTDKEREEFAKMKGWTQDANGNWKNGDDDVDLSSITDETIKDYLATQKSLVAVEEKFTGQLEAIEAEMRKITETELITKITTNAVGQIKGEDYKADVENWIKGLDAEGLNIVANLKIDYEDSLEDIQNKYREALSSKPIELDTSGFTKKQAKELQEEFELLTDYVYKNAESIDKLDDHLVDCRREASKVARAIMRMDDAVQDVTENYDAWNKALTSGSWQDAVVAANDLGKAYGNLLDLDGNELSDTFRRNTKNLALMKSAIEGNVDSYKKLQQAASQDLIMNVYFKEDEELQSKFLSLREKLQSIADDNNIKVGADLSTEPIYQELEELVKNCGLTAEEATNLLASMGVDAEVVSVPPKTEKVPTTETYWVPAEYEPDTSVDLSNSGSGPHTSFKIKEGTGYWKTETGYATSTTQGASSLKLISAHKSSGGDIKYEHASSSGGSGYAAGKSGSGGKKGSSSKKSTEKPKELTKKNTEEDRYHNIKEAIDDLTTALDRLSKNKDRAFGKQRLKYLDDEIKKTKEQVKLTEDYINEIKQYQKIDRGKLEGVLSSMGMSASDIASQFDENGVLKDYEQLYKDLQTAFNEGAVASLNKIEQEYNKAAEAWNASDQGDAAKAVWEAQKERLSNAQEIYKQQEETFKEQVEALKQYEETTNLLQEKQQELIDLQNKVYDQLVEVVKTKLEWKLELHENDRKLLEWTFKYIGDSADYAADKIANLSKQFDTTYKDIEDTQTAIQELFANHGMKNLDFSSGNADEILKQLDAYAKSENLPMLLTAEEVKTFEEYTQKLMADYDKLEEKAKEIHQTMMDATSEWLERIDKEVKKIDTATDKMQFLLDVINLTGKKDLGFTDEEIASFRQQRVDNAQAKVEISAKKLAELQKEADRVREELAKATDEDSRKRFQEDLDKYTEMIEDASAEWRDAYIDALEEAKKATEENLEMMVQTAKDSFGKFGLDFAQEQFARIKELSELYLPDYKKYSELNKSTNQLKKSLQETNNALIRGKMNDLLDEINEKMDSGVQMSETEAGIIERRVALLQAEAQLRDAQNAKSAVRMTRDNEGNFSYTYTADQDAIGAAGENYQEKFRELMEYEQNAIMEHQERMLQLRGDYLEAIKEAALVYGEGTEEFYEKAAEIYDYYQQKMDFETSQLNMLFDEQARLRDDDLKDIERIIGLKIAEEDNFTTFFNETVLSRVSGFETLEDFQQEWADMTQQTLDEAGQYWSQWKQNNEDILAGFRQNALEEFGKVQEEVKETKKSAEDMVDKMSEKFGENIEKTSTWEQEVGSKMAEMRKHITDTVSTINDMIAKLGEIGNDINNTASSAEQAAARLQQAAAQAAYAKSIIDGANGGAGGAGGSGGGIGDTLDNTTEDSNDPVIRTWFDATYSGKGGPWHASASTKEEINKLANDFAQSIYDDTFISVREFVETLKKGRRQVSSWTIQGKISKNAIKGTIGDFGFGGKFASGGYTGDWGNSSGKLAILHSKELVLNKDDTENMLNAVQLVRQIVAPQLSLDLNKGINYNVLANTGQSGIMEQQVHIDASFPNVQSHTEIEMALNNLINSATQYVNRKK